MVRQQRIGVLIIPGSMYHQRVGIAISHAIQARKNWTARLAGDLGGHVHSLFDWGPDGVITNVTPQNEAIEQLKSLGIPVVNFSGAMPDGVFPTVRPADRHIGTMAAEYLLNLNLKHFAYWADLPAANTERRRQGFIDALQKHNVPNSHMHAVQMRDSSDWHERDRTVRKWIDRLPKPVGLLAGHDLQAYYLCGVCREIGLDVPNEVALLGVDDDPLVCELADPPMSSIRPAVDQIGRVAVDILADLFDGCVAPSEPVLIPPLGVTSRGSTDMLAIEDPDIATAVRLIREQAAEGIGIPDILKKVPISRRSLERRFLAIFGRSPGTEIRRVRIERAKYLLLDSHHPIPIVAKLAGFRSAEYMTHVFRSKLGIPPTQYRRRPQDAKTESVR